MEVVRGVFLLIAVGLVGPVDANFLHGSDESRQKTAPKPNTYRLVDAAAIQGLHSSLSGTGVIVLDKSVVESLALELETKKFDVSKNGW